MYAHIYLIRNTVKGLKLKFKIVKKNSIYLTAFKLFNDSVHVSFKNDNVVLAVFIFKIKHLCSIHLKCQQGKI